MANIKIDMLEAHPKNSYFFDDISGDFWNDFVESIDNRLIEPIIATEAKNENGKHVIVSGHQRYRAYVQLGREKIPYQLQQYKTEDDVLLALLDANLKQRGNGNLNPVKLGRCLNELDRLYGIKRGNNQYTRAESNPIISDSTSPKTKKEIATMLGLSQDSLTDYQKVARLPERVQELVLSKELSYSNALRFAKKSSEEERYNIDKCENHEIISKIKNYGKEVKSDVKPKNKSAKSNSKTSADGWWKDNSESPRSSTSEMVRYVKSRDEQLKIEYADKGGLELLLSQHIEFINVLDDVDKNFNVENTECLGEYIDLFVKILKDINKLFNNPNESLSINELKKMQEKLCSYDDLEKLGDEITEFCSKLSNISSTIDDIIDFIENPDEEN